jgi:hypothetical protein
VAEVYAVLDEKDSAVDWLAQRLAHVRRSAGTESAIIWRI